MKSRVNYIITIIIFFICLLSVTDINAIPQNKDSLVTKAISNNGSQATIIEIKDADKIFAKEKKTFWEENANNLIALLTISIASLVSLITARWNTKVSKKQLELMKEQIDSSSKSALEKVKANNISSARIEWIKQLRPLLAELISKTSSLEDISRQLSDIYNEQAPEEQTEEEELEEENLYQKLQSIIQENEHIWNQILLFLNHNEPEHILLINNYRQYIENFELRENDQPITHPITEEQLIEMSITILKNAWEQAKNIK